MPTYKNVSDEDVAGIVGVGLIKPGEVKTVADPVEHPSLEQVDDQEAHQLQATEPDSDQAPAATELQATAAPAIVSPVPSAPATPPAAPANTNPNSQGA